MRIDSTLESYFDVSTPQGNGCGPRLKSTTGGKRTLKQRIFEFVRSSGQTARTDISRALDISPGSATTLTADLIEAGYLREVAGLTREAGRGRPPVALEVVQDAHYVIGIKLSDEKNTAVLADFAGNMVADCSLPNDLGRRDLEALLDEISALMETLLEESGNVMADVKAVGIGVSGIIDHEAGTVLWSPLLQLREVALGDAFIARFGIPVSLDNDANVLTLAELWFGAGRDMDNFAVVTIEHGVGMGVVVNNQLYRGAQGKGLELGHTKVQLDGALCRCGQRGCLEAYLADYALAREAATALGRSLDTDQSPQEMLEHLFLKAKAGDLAAQTIFNRAGRYLSAGLSNVIQLFDPPLIILSGERMQYDYLYGQEVIAEMHSLTLSEGRTPCMVETHAWGDLIWARGASALALSAMTDRLFSKETQPA
ncbi:MAG: ROK family protein [Yoonia sp.]|uniref:ROK family protein n=1 Tax=Yoonia sp. TaxID=2212373 RepID=UPI00326748E4